MFNRKLYLSLVFLFVVLSGTAQNCNISIQGYVFDEGSNEPLPYVTIFVQENAKGAITDNEGNFRIDHVCEGEYHLTFSHIGCETKKLHLDIRKDTTIHLGIPHTTTSLNTIVIEGAKDEYNQQNNLTINRKTLEENNNKNLAGILENISGVTLIKNGSGISKPVIHGLYGNRLTILNNGIIQSGQQWGNDHSPEIDPYAADKIIVLKGVNAIEYGAGNLGSVILVEPKPIEREPHLHGQVNYFFESNGRGHGMNTRLEKHSKTLAWRLTGTLKKFGDKKTPEYYLKNTGIEELNLAVQLEKSIKDKLFLELYASTFNTKLGILRGSHLGNLTDLELALSSNTPFFTEPNFSYDIEAPRQNVSHHLIKGKVKYYLNKNQSLEFVIASQFNHRKEFDIRRGGRSDIPALSLAQYATNLDIKYMTSLWKYFTLKVGAQNIITDNTNNPETGILPLIPDYFSWKSGVFSSLSKRQNNIDFSLSFRYDYEFQNVLTISKSLPRKIIKYENKFHNVSGLFAIKIDLPHQQSFALNTGYAMRNPAVNELYSNGLHQGVSGIEEGDENLQTEKAIKNTIEYKWQPNANFFISTLAFNQYFKDYIFLNPQDEIRLTIRGAFPVFSYEQTDANIYGFDVSSQVTISNAVLFNLNYSYLKGKEIVNKKPLVLMPSNSFFGSVVYRVRKSISLSKNMFLEESEIELNNRVVFEQKNILPEQDFVVPPPTYNILGVKFSTNIHWSTFKIKAFVKADNLINVKYRNYLNRQRYFADDIGISFTSGLNFKF